MPNNEPPSSSAVNTSGCIILAAGGSKRLGQPKQLVPFEGLSLIERTVTAALETPRLWPIIVVLGGNAELIRPVLRRYPVLVADNPAWAEGIASSLRTGITTLNQFSINLERALITLCDQPHLSSQAFTKILDAQRQSRSDLVAAHYQGHPGAPALFGRKYFDQLGQLTGDEGARTIFRAIPADEITAVELPDLSLDLDTPDDYQKITGQALKP